MVYTRVLQWLQHSAIEDPLDRRHAVGVQLLLLLLVIGIPLSWLLRWFSGEAPLVNMLASLSLACWAGGCLWLLRRGRFRVAVCLFLAAFHLLLWIGYAAAGLQAQYSSQVPHALGVLLAALLLGRRMLWWSLLAVLVAVALGVWRDLAEQRASVLAQVPRVLLGFLLVGVLLDRFAVVSREWLHRERRRAEELAATHAQLAHEMNERERLQHTVEQAELDQRTELLTAGLAHELNTVLAQCYAKLGHALEALPGQPQLLALRDSMDQAAGRIERVLALGRRKDSAPIQVMPQAVLTRLEPGLRACLPPRARLRLDLDPVPALAVAETDLAQVVRALVHNAAHALMPDGQVQIRLTVGPHQGRLGIVLVVTDDGLGMDAAQLRAVGKALFSPEAVAQPGNAGLGLVQTRMLVERYGGHLDVDSVPGAGTTVRVWWPGPSTQTDAPVNVQVDCSRVLLVDDDQDVCGLMSLVLTRAGFSVDVAETVEAARVARQRYGNRVPLVVMDRNLPDGDGVSLLEEFARCASGLHAVFSSVQALRDHERHRLAPINLVELNKPYAPERMVDALRELCARFTGAPVPLLDR